MQHDRVAVAQRKHMLPGRQVDRSLGMDRGDRLEVPPANQTMRLKCRRLKRWHLSVYDSDMQTIRSFIAIPLSVEVRRTAVRLIERLRQEGDGIKWVPTDNLHLTLKFLGEVDNTEVPAICDRLHRITEQYQPFELVFFGTGGFPNTERARVLWAGVQDDSGSLCRMVAQLETELAELGYKPEPRDYRPHLTLGRTRSGSRRASADVVARIQAESKAPLGKLLVDRVQLFASFLDKGGPTYQVMDTIEL